MILRVSCGLLLISRIHNLRMDDLEAVNKKTAPVDMDEVVKPFFNQLRDTKLMPDDILRMFSEVASIQRREAENMDFYAENLKTHTGAIDTLGKSVERLTAVVERLDKSKVDVDVDSLSVSEFRERKVAKLLGLS